MREIKGIQRIMGGKNKDINMRRKKSRKGNKQNKVDAMKERNGET